MEDLLYSINAVVPLFILVALGYYIRQKDILSLEFVDIFSKFAFNIGIPLSLFNTAFNSNIHENVSIKFVIYNSLAIIMIVAIAWIVVPRFTTLPRAGSIIQGVYRANLAIFGLPLATNMFGSEHIAPTAIMIAISVPIYNSISVIQLSLMGKNSKKRPSVFEICISVIKNPLFFATVMGILFSYFSVPIPQMLATPINNLAACAAPIALIALGGQFSFSSAKNNFKISIITTIIRLLVVPAVLMPIFIVAGFRDGELGALLINFATPIATSTFVMALHFGCDENIAGELVLFSIFFSMFTIFGWIFLLRALGFI